MNQKLIAIILTFTLMCPNAITAQQSYADAYEKQADKAINDQYYSEALDLYTTARRFVKQSLQLDYKIAQTNMLLSNYARAEEGFKAVIARKDTINISFQFPRLYLELAQMSKQNNKLQQALDYIDLSLKDCPDMQIRGELKRERATVLWILDNQSVNTNTTIINPGPNINNSLSQSGGQLIDSLFLYNKFSDDSFIDFAFADEDFHTPSKHLEWGKINDNAANSSNLFFDTVENIAYWTKKAGNMPTGVTKIYFSHRERADKWSKPQILPFCKEDAASYTHPFVILKDGQKIMFFASDRAGGYGGYDIWQINLFNPYSQPINLGNKINTAGNEVTPFFIDSVLYFASDTHYGYGGYDIFSSQCESGKWQSPVNLMPPINSTANDLYPVIVKPNQRGYLTSNRSDEPRSQSDPTMTCCNQIYLWKTEVQTPQEDPEQVINYAKTIEQRFIPAFDLPLMLYYHNDQPNQSSKATLTDYDYATCYKQYLGMKSLYQSQYALNKDTAGYNAVSAFFINKIDFSMTKLDAMMAYLLQQMEEGKSLDVQVRGFSSTLFTSDYNFNLSERRINALENYIGKWNGGLLAPYLTHIGADGKPRLRILHLPMGSSQSVSSNPQSAKARRQSVYTLEAMEERKVEIKIIFER
ncbi:MAG: hypothetical protein LBO06_04765 [Bacteroidales bacterium]|jgi:hypothetical protein|nr:hypothetical protein [Bacteroidales bacterium]